MCYVDESADLATRRAELADYGFTCGCVRQVLTLVHFSAQFERFVSDRGCSWGLCSPC
jgi:hypothetical protein